MFNFLADAFSQIRYGLVNFVAMLPSIILGFVVFSFFVWTSTLARNQSRRIMMRLSKNRTLAILIARLVRGLVVSIGVLIGMTIALPTFQPSELIQILGIGGVAIGFAFRSIFENFLAGILIMINQPFEIGDQIIAGDYEGTVDDIQISNTYIKTYDGRLVVIPNSQLFTSSVMVNTAFKHRRSEYDVGIDYEDDIEAAQQIMLDVMSNTDGVLSTPEPDTVMMEMGDSSIIIRVRWWTHTDKASVMRVQNRVLVTMKNRLTEAGFNIPFPIRTVMFHDQNTPAAS